MQLGAFVVLFLDEQDNECLTDLNYDTAVYMHCVSTFTSIYRQTSLSTHKYM